jgi:uncharacterized protein (TIGR02300 family)
MMAAATMEAMRKLRGTKRTCRSCDERFYDLDRDPTVCPSCGASLAQSGFERVVSAHTGYQRSGWGAAKPAMRVVQGEDESAVLAVDDEAEDKVADEAEATVEGDVLLEDEGDDDVADLLTPDEPTATDE